MTPVVVLFISVLLVSCATTVEPPLAPHINKLNSRDKDVIRTGIRGLMESEDPEAFDVLVAALQNENRDVRDAAAEALGDSGDERAVMPLIQVLSDSRNYFTGIRKAAVIALGKIADPRAADHLIELLDDYELGSYAVQSLVRIGKPAVQSLIRTLSDKNLDKRANAAEALGEIGDAAAVEPLISIIGRGYNQYPITALGKLGDPRAIEWARINGFVIRPGGIASGPRWPEK